MRWHRDELVTATRGTLLQEGSDQLFSRIVTDSRAATRGSVFLALKGERLDGHDFLRQAVRRGARCVVVHRPVAPRLPRAVTVIKVGDTLTALGDLARYRRRRRGPTVLAITGSNGKTTTKEMVAAILQKAFPPRHVLRTEGNYNNLIGLPLTLLRLEGERFAVLELGTNRPGEIRRLVEIAEPDVGLITSIAPAHLEGLGTLAGVAREKGALFRGLGPNGIAVVNLDDPWVRRLAKGFRGRKVSYGRRGRVRAGDIRVTGEGTAFSLVLKRARRAVRLRLLGRHHVSNALAAAAMASAVNAPLGAIVAGLEAVRPSPMRMELSRWRGVRIINDAYNANPASMEAALATLAELAGPGRRLAALGDMLELGRRAREEHLELGRRAASHGVRRLYLFGKNAVHVVAGARRAGMTEERLFVGSSHAEIAARIRRDAVAGDVLLVKGSRGMRMEKVIEALTRSGD